MFKAERITREQEPITDNDHEPVLAHQLSDEELNRRCEAMARKGFCPSKPEPKKAG